MALLLLRLLLLLLLLLLLPLPLPLLLLPPQAMVPARLGGHHLAACRRRRPRRAWAAPAVLG